MKQIILASQSTYKAQLLGQLQIPFVPINPVFEESFEPGLLPGEQAVLLAEGKAQAVWRDHMDAVVIGADQVLAFRNRLLQKPGTVEKAVEQLKQLRGTEHFLHTAVTVIEAETGTVWNHLETARLKMNASISDSYLRKVVEKDATWDCVGGYKLESLGITLFDEVKTDDFTSIIGLPLLALSAKLRSLGYIG